MVWIKPYQTCGYNTKILSVPEPVPGEYFGILLTGNTFLIPEIR